MISKIRHGGEIGSDKINEIIEAVNKYDADGSKLEALVTQYAESLKNLTLDRDAFFAELQTTFAKENLPALRELVAAFASLQEFGIEWVDNTKTDTDSFALTAQAILSGKPFSKPNRRVRFVQAHGTQIFPLNTTTIPWRSPQVLFDVDNGVVYVDITQDGIQKRIPFTGGESQGIVDAIKTAMAQMQIQIIRDDIPYEDGHYDYYWKIGENVYDGREHDGAYFPRVPVYVQGQPGPQGPQGPQGKQGEKGEDGMTGQTGATGRDGADARIQIFYSNNPWGMDYSDQYNNHQYVGFRTYSSNLSQSEIDATPIQWMRLTGDTYVPYFSKVGDTRSIKWKKVQSLTQDEIEHGIEISDEMFRGKEGAQGPTPVIRFWEDGNFYSGTQENDIQNNIVYFTFNAKQFKGPQGEPGLQGEVGPEGPQGPKGSTPKLDIKIKYNANAEPSVTSIPLVSPNREYDYDLTFNLPASKSLVSAESLGTATDKNVTLLRLNYRYTDGTEADSNIIEIPNGVTPTIRDGYWYIGNERTNYKAVGTDGVDGKYVVGFEIDKEPDATGAIPMYWTFSDGTKQRFGDWNAIKGKDGEAGAKGADGVGIETLYVDQDGTLRVRLTDKSAERVYDVRGPKGADGVSITDATLTSEGDLKLSLSNGTSIVVGSVKGERGETGAQGPVGPKGDAATFSITGTTTSTQLQLTHPTEQNVSDMWYCTDTSTLWGCVKQGEEYSWQDTKISFKGEDGRGIASVQITEDYKLKLNYTDGKSETLNTVILGPKGNTGERGQEGPQGPAGKNGITWDSGTGDPTNSNAATGDLYLDISSGKVWKKSASSWSYICSIKGPQGEQGKEGPQGREGPQGQPGLNGTNGNDGAPGKDGKDGKDGINGQNGERGPAGKDGANIKSIDIVQLEEGNGGYKITITVDDEVEVTNGVSKAKTQTFTVYNGKPGLDGQPGPAGQNGANGKDGAAGTNGKDGVGIKSTAIQFYASSNLIADPKNSIRDWDTWDDSYETKQYVYAKLTVRYTSDDTPTQDFYFMLPRGMRGTRISYFPNEAAMNTALAANEQSKTFVEGDFIFCDDTKKYHIVKSESSGDAKTWKTDGGHSLQGEVGPRGAQVWSGTTEFSSSTATHTSANGITYIVNDIYINTNSWNVFRCISGGIGQNATWEKVNGSLKGPQGIQGVRGASLFTGNAITAYNGTSLVGPNDSQAYIVGDFYINTLRGTHYKCVVAGTGNASRWTYEGSFTVDLNIAYENHTLVFF